jgi:hypothetical protein
MTRRAWRSLRWLPVPLLLPVAFLFGSRIELLPEHSEDAVERAMEARMAQAMERLRLPQPVEPPREFAPFGRPITPRVLQGDAARGLLLTNLGHADWDAGKDAVAAGMPAALRLAPGDIQRGANGALHPGLNYLRLGAAQIEARGLDAVAAELGEHARILGWLPESAVIAWVEPRDLGALGRSALVDRSRPLEPYNKISPLLGTLPRLSRREAENPDLLARVTFVPGHGGEGALEAIGRLPGVSEVIPAASSGNDVQLRIRFDQVAGLARRDEVLWIEPVLDYVLANAENVPTMQAGSAEDANFARPFDAAGVDGGGLDTNGDGMRINNGTDAVPPQIVTVTDNGISFDTPSFSQTCTNPTTFPNPIGSSHRKIHAIQNVQDTGTSCDAQLSGGSTHGNVVASVIAAAPSVCGVFGNRSGLGGPGEPRNMNMDGVARGARIILQDAGTVAQCTINSLIERGGNISPGLLSDRLNAALAGAGSDGHLAIFPFGAPNNFGPIMFFSTNGTYPAEASQVDTFLYNNRDYALFVPVGNNGATPTNNRNSLWLPIFPDLFNGTDIDNDPNFPSAIQVSPPATAKNVVAVGVSDGDCFTVFGPTDCEGFVASFTSRGPATPQSLRMSPILTAPGVDAAFGPFTTGVAVFRSRDNDNLAPVEAQLDEGNAGSSFSSAYVTGAAAVLRDYFAQGFYPTGSRGAATDRMPGISGALVKAALAASADFDEGLPAPQPPGAGANSLRRTRCLDLGIVGGIGVDILCNSEQGYGRPVLTSVLPLGNWSDDFVLHPASTTPREYPAAGLLVFDRQGTGEGLIDNGANTSRSHLFRIASPATLPTASGGLQVAAAQLRLALAWADPPSPAGSGGPLINDLDLRLESPGPDSCLQDSDTRPDGTPCPAGSAADNVFYDGNAYDAGRNVAALDQWSLGRAAASEKHDKRNPLEAVHLTSDPNNDRSFADSPIYAGRWRVTVKRGLGGATPGQITITVPTVAQDPDQDEDDNNNGRLDGGEDNNANGLLDQPGQPYALVIAGPVFAAEAPPPAGPQSFPASRVSLDRVSYDCGSSAVATVLDTTPGSAALASSATTFIVLGPTGIMLDTETGISFQALGVPGASASAAVPVRLTGPAVSGDGILEVDTGQTLRVRYVPAGQVAMTADAAVRCSPDLVGAFFTTQGGRSVGSQVSIQGGCDNDPFPDAGEVVSYGVALQNRSRSDAYSDVVATLTPSGPGAAAVRVLDSPKPIGLLPEGGANAVFFQVYVDPVLVSPLSAANRVVTMRLDLDSSDRGVRLGRQTYSFTHALTSDQETFRYSTDHLSGGREIRDLNRSGVIDPPGGVDPILGYVLPAEDVTFSTLFSGSGAPALHFTNELGEDLNLNNQFDVGLETNVIPNVDGGGGPLLDRGILNSNNPADPAHRAPWSFDGNSGGWVPFRHPDSTAAGVGVNPLWEYKTSGQCGFQTSGGFDKFGVWHTGDGNPATPPGGALACDDYDAPADLATPARVEALFDVLESPIVAKVNQAADPRGFAYTVEFQRLGLNIDIQIVDQYASGGINVDNDVDNDGTNSLLVQNTDTYYMRKFGGWPSGVFRFSGQYFGPSDGGIDPMSIAPHQRTFGPFTNDNGSIGFDGDETGFTGWTQNHNPDSSNPIPTAIPDLLPYPLPGVITPGVCDGGTAAKAACAPGSPSDPCVTGGGVCTPQDNTVAGPVRNFDTTLSGYEGGFASLNWPGALENVMTMLPGPAGNRWQIAIGFTSIESASGATDFGISIDDVVFEWNEWHPQDETALGAPPACSRFGGAGQPAGGQCATVTVDRTTLYECDESIEVTVHDAKCAAIGSGNTVPLGGACVTHAQCGTGGSCTAALASVEVAVVTDSDAVIVTVDGQPVLTPTAKRFTLPAVAGNPGLYRGRVPFSTVAGDADSVHAAPASDTRFAVFYFDPLCDGDRDGQAGEDAFDNGDGDGIATAADKCPAVYDPGQEDADGDGAGDLCDDCPAVSDPAQADINADGIGDLCEFDDMDGDAVRNDMDNCPDVRNGTQSDIDGDGRGDLCDTLKTSGTTFVGSCNTLTGQCSAPASAVGAVCATNADCIRTCNAGVCTNNSAYTSPVPMVGHACATHAQCFIDLDRDADGVLDANDNCVLAPNGPLLGPNNQLDSNGNGLGDVCDPDCTGTTVVYRCRATGAACTVPETAQAACNNTLGLGNICAYYLANTGGCSTVVDDFDADGVEDLSDSCPSVANPRVTAFSPQADRDRDGLGDACDPSGSFDDTGDGTPDDAVSFQGSLACSQRPLARLSLVGLPTYLDIDGDHDAFPDTGERGRVSIVVKNTGDALEDAVFTLLSADPDVACITESQLVVPSLAAGATVTLGSLDPAQPGFTFVASDSLQAPGPPGPVPVIDLGLQVVAAGHLGLSGGLSFSLLADVNVPPGSQVFVVGGDGIAGTADDGTVKETFDVDRDGDGKFTVRDTFLRTLGPGVHRGTCSNAPATDCVTAADCPASPPGAICYSGAYIRGDAAQGAPDRVAAVACGPPDFREIPCMLDPDYPMDWHLHCPPGSSSCPNLESGTCVGGCSFNTPANGQKSHSGPNSLHMGAHFDPTNALNGDTTHLRTLQGYMTAPINLAIFPRPGDLDFSFFHIARLMDNNGFGPGNANQCADCGDVQIQLDQEPDPAIDTWGFWDKLVPYQNVYDHKPTAWSTFGSYYCFFTPTDTGTAPPNPRGVHETICYPQGAWSHCGSTTGTTPTTTGNCPGPGEVDPTGVGVWVQTRFHLDPYMGQRIRIRWIAETWNFDEATGSYYEFGNGWNTNTEDDGWWLDDIALTGVVTQPMAVTPDTTPRTGTCPSDPCNAAVGDAGTSAAIAVSDASGNAIDGVTRIPTSGERIRLDAGGSSFPGGCSNGRAEYRFLRDGAVAQDWSDNPFFIDSPERTTRYTALLRCTSDPGCASVTGASIDLPVRTGDGGDVVFGARGSAFDPGAGVLYYRGACSAGTLGAPCNAASDCGGGGACNLTASTADDTTLLRLWGASDDGLDVVRGIVPVGGPKGTLAGSFWTLPGLAGPCFLSNLAPTAAATGFNHSSGPLTQAQDANPAVGAITYYQAAANNTAGANLDAYGCPSPSICSNPGWCELGTGAGGPCTTNADCPGGGTCLHRTIFCSRDAGVAGPNPNDGGGCGHHATCTGGANAGRLCYTNTDCPSGVCPAASAAQQATEGQVCLTLTGAPLAPSPYGNCPPAGHPKRLVSRSGVPACP